MSSIAVGTALVLLIGAGGVGVAGWTALEPMRRAEMETGVALTATAVGLMLAVGGGVGVYWAFAIATVGSTASITGGLVGAAIAVLGLEVAAIAAGQIDWQAASRDVP